jgi:hypothetical protein
VFFEKLRLIPTRKSLASGVRPGEMLNWNPGGGLHGIETEKVEEGGQLI